MYTCIEIKFTILCHIPERIITINIVKKKKKNRIVKKYLFTNRIGICSICIKQYIENTF